MLVRDAMQQRPKILDQLKQQNRNSTFWHSSLQRLTNILKTPINKTRAHVMSTQAQPPLSTPKAGSPTLLTIPQELRDTIFAHVFDTTALTGTMDLRIIFYTDPGTREQSVHAGTFPQDAAPPTKDALLVCRQLHAEFKQAHAATYRHWWQAQRFAVTIDSPFMIALLRPVAEEYLRRICWLAIAPVTEVGRGRSRVKVLVSFRFEATTDERKSLWSTAIERSPVCKARLEEVLPWHLTGCARREAFLRSLEGLVDDIREDSGGIDAVDPMVGRGLTAGEMFALSGAVQTLLLDAENA